MRPTILLVLLAQAGCLFAPARPDSNPNGGTSDAGTNDAGNDDGSGIGIGNCPPANTSFGLSLTLVAGANDVLVRVGHNKTWHLFAYAANARAGACPSARFKFSDNLTSVDALLPMAATSAAAMTDVLALATLGQDSLVMDVRATSTSVAEVGRVTATGFHAQPIPSMAGSDAAAFIAWDPGRELWFGGGPGGIAVADVSMTVAGTATVLPVSTMDSWYSAIALKNPHGAKRFALIGAAATYEAMDSAGSIMTSAPTAHACTQPCQRLAYTLATPIAAPIEAFSIDRVTGTVETVQSAQNGLAIASHKPSPTGVGVVLDVAIGDLIGDTAIDAAVLWGSQTPGPPAQLIVYDGLLTRDPAAAIGPLTLDARINRIAVVRTASGPHILALSDQAGVDRCLRVAADGHTFEDCP